MEEEKPYPRVFPAQTVHIIGPRPRFYRYDFNISELLQFLEKFASVGATSAMEQEDAYRRTDLERPVFPGPADHGVRDPQRLRSCRYRTHHTFHIDRDTLPQDENGNRTPRVSISPQGVPQTHFPTRIRPSNLHDTWERSHPAEQPDHASDASRESVR